MRLLFLLPGLSAIGGMQRRDRLLVLASDSIYSKSLEKHLTVLSLNDYINENEPDEIRNLKHTKIKKFNGNRIKFVYQALIEFFQSDIVFIGLLGFSPLVILFRILSKTKKIFLLMHGVEVWQRRRGLYRFAVSKLDGSISISKFTLEKFREAYNQKPKMDFLLPNSLGPDNEINFDHNNYFEPRLLTVARLSAEEKYKGVDTVIHAISSLVHEFPTIIYEIIGDGSDKKRLQNLASELKLESNILFRGFVSNQELLDAYRKCTVFVMPSGGEGFGLVFLEAMARGKPVIGAKSGGTPEVIIDGETGFLVEYGNISELEEKIRKLLVDEGSYNKMKKSCLSVVKEKFVYKVFEENVEKILTRIESVL